MMSDRIGMGLANFPFSDVATMWRWIDLCEDNGVDSIWQTDRLISREPILESMTFMAALAARTEKLKFGMNVVVVGFRDPLVLAKQCATIDFLSNGRMLPAFGVGGGFAPEWQVTNRRLRGRAPIADEMLDIINGLWNEESFTYHGEHFTYENATISPRPVQDPLPLWIGGHSQAALRRAGRFGDGWMGVASSELFETGDRALAAIRRYAEEAGRDPAALGFQAQVSPPPRPGNESDRTFYTDPGRVAASAAKLVDLGFDGVALNLTGLFLAGARTVGAMINGAAALHEKLRTELG